MLAPQTLQSTKCWTISHGHYRALGVQDVGGHLLRAPMLAAASTGSGCRRKYRRPLELYQCIKEMGNGERCAFPRLLERLQKGPEPRLALDPEFKPEAEPQSDEDRRRRLFLSYLDTVHRRGETGPVWAKVMAVLRLL
jgi:hypothetical protein